MNKTHSQLTILHDSQEWNTKIEGEIGEIKVDGKKLSDIHDLTLKIDKMTTIIKALALTATFLSFVAVAGGGYVCSWIALHHDQINTTLDTTEDRFSTRITQLHNQNQTYAKKLSSLGWHWKVGEGWQQTVNTTKNVSK